jgi:hypothetical protein
MQDCIKCGTPTELYVSGGPMCPKCFVEVDESQRSYTEESEILAVSVRVLTAITDGQLPAQSDIDMVTAFAGPRPAGMDLDEFICDVIRSTTEQRDIARNSQESPAVSIGTR